VEGVTSTFKNWAGRVPSAGLCSAAVPGSFLHPLQIPPQRPNLLVERGRGGYTNHGSKDHVSQTARRRAKHGLWLHDWYYLFVLQPGVGLKICAASPRSLVVETAACC
jgi:hypothetical protein